MSGDQNYQRFENQVREVDRGFVNVAREGRRSSTRGRRRWQARYSKFLLLSDLLLAAAAIFVTQWLWLPPHYRLRLEPLGSSVTISYYSVSLMIVSFWILILLVARAYDSHIVAFGDAEYISVVRASLITFALVSAIAYWSKTELARGYLLIAFPVGTILLIGSRWLWRQWLASQWRQGKMKTPVLVIGEGKALDLVLANLIGNYRTPYSVVAISDSLDPKRPVEQGVAHGNRFLFVPFSDDVSRQMEEVGAEVAVIVAGPLSPPERIRSIGWSLDQSTQQMLLTPGLTDVAGPRISVKPAAGMPLMEVDPAGPSRMSQFLKRMFDIGASAVLIVLLSPLLLIVSAIVKVTDWGPVFYKQERIGFMAKPFWIWKFRSMRVNADKLEAQMIAEGDAGNAVQFKMKNDPRITKIGRFIRRYSIDELPQLFNVLGGSMSLIGPRPHQAREVDLYEEEVYRRFLVKPGITGLWQVSGRSNLSWEDSVRLDLYYVENWSFIGDIRILWQTLKAVLDGDGAY